LFVENSYLYLVEIIGLVKMLCGRSLVVRVFSSKQSNWLNHSHSLSICQRLFHFALCSDSLSRASVQLDSLTASCCVITPDYTVMWKNRTSEQ